MPLSTGQVLQQRYRIVTLLGQGGFGAVYRAWDLNLEKPVAAKENLDTSPEAQRQFKQEAKILADLSHPHLPRVTDHFFIPDQGQYLVMDFVEGEDLQAMLDRLGLLPEAGVMLWIEQVCDALNYLHDHSPPIIHRDIKPANIKIRPDGRAVLVDFGIAKVYDPHLATTIGAKAVTPGFSPPEQYGQGKTDARSDVYALGATLYALLTGQTPPESVQRMAGSVILREPRILQPYLTLRTEQVILKALDVTTSKRFQNISEFRAALTKHDDSTKVDSPLGRKKSSSLIGLGMSRKVWFGVWVVVALLVVAGLVWITRLDNLSALTNSTASIPTVFLTFIELDGQQIDIDDDSFQEVACNTSHRLEVKLQDGDQQRLQPDLFTYNWRFGPSDEQNQDKLDSANYAISYYVPCQLHHQTVTVEVLRWQQTLYTQGIRFKITK